MPPSLRNIFARSTNWRANCFVLLPTQGGFPKTTSKDSGTSVSVVRASSSITTGIKYSPCSQENFRLRSFGSFVFAFFLIGEDINWFKKIEESNIEAEAGQDAGRLFNIYADYLFFENMSESCIFLNIEGFSITLMFVRELPVGS